jgi:GntR family transcriptional regulator, transcriptional repressor for pyruvate dehydrogenase complex
MPDEQEETEQPRRARRREEPSIEGITRIPRTPVSEKVSRQILDLILTRRVLPGQKIPSEQALIAAMGVSRASVREALHGLTVLGFLEGRQGSGHFVRESKVLTQMEDQVELLLGDHTGILDLQEARRVVEPVAITLAAQRALPEDLVLMDAALTRYDDAVRHGEPRYEVGWQVHEAFAKGCHNPALFHMVSSLIKVTGSLQGQIYEPAGVHHDERDVQDHRAIYEAIASRAPEDALGHIMRHLGRVERTLWQALVVVARSAISGQTPGSDLETSSDRDLDAAWETARPAALTGR